MKDKTIEAFLRRDDIQEYLKQEDLDRVFDEWCKEYLTKYLRQFFESDVNINPLDYMTEVPPGYFFNEDMTKIIIPEGVQVLHQNCACLNKKLEEVYLPSTITRIFDNSFDGCTNLSKIYYNGTSDDFYDKLSVDDFCDDSEVTIYCSNGSFPWLST